MAIDQGLPASLRGRDDRRPARGRRRGRRHRRARTCRTRRASGPGPSCRRTSCSACCGSRRTPRTACCGTSRRACRSAGLTGTLSDRYTQSPARGLVRAKTGSLPHVTVARRARCSTPTRASAGVRRPRRRHPRRRPVGSARGHRLVRHRVVRRAAAVSVWPRWTHPRRRTLSTGSSPPGSPAGWRCAGTGGGPRGADRARRRAARRRRPRGRARRRRSPASRRRTGRPPEQVSTVLVVDRPRWAQANAEMFAAMTGPLARRRRRRSTARAGAAVQVGGVLALLSGKVLGQFDPFTSTGRPRPAAPRRAQRPAPRAPAEGRPVGLPPLGGAARADPRAAVRGGAVARGPPALARRRAADGPGRRQGPGPAARGAAGGGRRGPSRAVPTTGWACSTCSRRGSGRSSRRSAR